MITQALKPFKAIAWYFGELMGDHDYQKYCDHLRIHHPDQPIPSEREYWRRRHSDAEANPPVAVLLIGLLIGSARTVWSRGRQFIGTLYVTNEKTRVDITNGRSLHHGTYGQGQGRTEQRREHRQGSGQG